MDCVICSGLVCKRRISCTKVLGIHSGKFSGNFILKTAIEDSVRTRANNRKKVALFKTKQKKMKKDFECVSNSLNNYAVNCDKRFL